MERCTKEPDIEILKEHVKTLYQKHDETKKWQEKYEGKQDVIYDISKSIAVMAEKMGGIREDVQQIKGEVLDVKKDVGALKEKMQSDKRQDLKDENDDWRKYKWQIVFAITGLVIGYFFNALGGL